MKFLTRLKNRLISKKYIDFNHYLCNADPNVIIKKSEKELLKTFHKVVTSIPVYKNIFISKIFGFRLLFQPKTAIILW